MKRTRRAAPELSDDLQPEYQFDYSKARPNPYAGRLEGRTVTVVLDPDVAAAFPTSEAVNRQLRAAVRPVARRSSRHTPAGKPAKRTPRRS
ncbi:MAG TPA: hypothetical protein VGB87_06520 [Vicinamibacteria bacterium]